MNLNDLLSYLGHSWTQLLNLLHIYRTFGSDTRLDGKVVLITGANTGLGKETALQLCQRGGQVIIGCRNLVAADDAIKDIKAKNSSAVISALELDLSSLSSVRIFAKKILEKVTKIDIMINNAGIALCPEKQSEDGFELQFATNYLGHFLLTLSLLPLLEKSSRARIIAIASSGHAMARLDFSNINLRNGVYSPLKAYN